MDYLSKNILSENENSYSVTPPICLTDSPDHNIKI